MAAKAGTGQTRRAIAVGAASIEDRAAANALDQEQVARFLRTRDEVCFRQLWRAHTPALLLLALRMTGGAQADSEDAVQEAWIRAVRGLPDFRWNSSLRTWLCGITINCCREILRQRRRQPDGTATDKHAVGTGPRAAFGATDLESLLCSLPDGARQVLVLHDIEGYTHEEIAVILEIEPGTSKSQLSRARAAMRRLVTDRLPSTEQRKGATP